MPILHLAVLLLLLPFAAQAAELDIRQYRETFTEDFRGKLDVTPWGPSRWIAHTPWHGDFGDARFADPQPGFPFITGPGGLKITARKDTEGKWSSGLLCTLDEAGHGFAQANGYFEARMKMPAGPGVWPAFWLIAPGGADYKPEIDVVEYYGVATDRYQVNTHLWPKSPDVKPQGEGKSISVPRDSLVESYHLYGVEITDGDVIFYLDRREVARMKASPAMHQPMSILVNLALGSGWPIDKTYNPSILQVDYIKVYVRKGH